MGVAGGVLSARAPNLAAGFFLLGLLSAPGTLAQTISFTPSPTYEFMEEQPVGTAVAVLEAFYIVPPFDLRADGSFSLDPSQSDSQFFSIESSVAESVTLGTLRTAVVFDRDAEGSQTVFDLTVTYSLPDGSLSSSEEISIILGDINDNAPQFSQPIYSVSIPEQSAPGASVLQVTADDIDSVVTEQPISEDGESFEDLRYLIDYGRVLYSITGGNEQLVFEIDDEGGTIFLAPETTLSVDEQDLYNITVTATDGPGLNSSAVVLVEILDSNDHAPQILSPRGVNLSLSEDTPLGLVILDSINATDEDRGLNSEIEFVIIAGDDTGSFSIDADTGQVTLSAPLDREGGTGEIVNLTIAARDRGNPPLQDTINIIIFIDDVNDFPPSFEQEEFMGSVREGVRSEFSVLQVVASDGDGGQSGVITYSILEGADGKFTIDPQTGEILTNGTLDREERDMYQFTVRAVDNPLNISLQLSSVVNVTIAIDDVNDNIPVFNQSSYEKHILDNLTRGSDVILISATDRDEGVNAEITYQFIEPLPDNSDRFRIQEQTGQVKVNRRPRFDIQTIYTYTIQALDGGTPVSQSDPVTLTIYIHDVDETPPTFEQDSYNTTLTENVTVGTVVLQVNATDPDPGAIGQVEYVNLTVFDEAGSGSFGVNATTGEIYVATRLNYDVGDYIFFQVEARDGGFPEPFTDLTNVTIFLEGTNDEPPSIIFPKGYAPTVPEDEPPGYEIVYLSQFTIDPDRDLEDGFEFEISEIYDPYSGGNDSFSLNTTTGLLISLRTFDRESQPKVMVAIETRDFGTPPQSNVTNITVVVGDKNDQVPYFPSNASIEAYEFLPPGELILEEYRAVDNDTGINAELRYEIYAGDPRRQFLIDPQTGDLFTNATLNKTDQEFYNLTIIALDGGTPQFHAFGQISVEVIDANDQAPVFSLDVYNATVSEAAAVGTVFFQVNATDQDIGTNSIIHYFIVPVSNDSDTLNDRFTVDNTTGEIATSDRFDRENETNFTLTVIAIDDGVIPMRLTGTATVIVHIEDYNDHTPIFDNATYSAVVIENAAIGTFIVSVSADDEDAEFPNNAIQFSLNGSRSDEFQIDPTSGDITVAGEVDWEEGEEINIIVIATDMGEPAQSSTANVTILVRDINDRAPIFSPESLTLGILENTDPPRDVGNVTAIDPDSAGNNSLVSYEVVMDLAGGRFQLDQETGLVTFVRGSLNRERRSFYEMVVRALDHGDPQRFTDASLIIEVLDSNDFDPVFELDLFVGSVSENASVGTTILTLLASDVDVGVNGALIYSILSPQPPIDSLFTVNETSGDILTAGTGFDYEQEVTSYSFTVMVTDQGIPPRSHTSQVTIEVTDFNDNPPIFLNESYSATMEENLSPFTTVLQVAASDDDSGDNKAIQYSLADGEGREYFDIDPDTGVLYTTRYIDREVTPSFSLTAVANNSLSPFPLSRTVPITVNISDLSDTHPSFDIVTEEEVSEGATVGSVVFTLVAVDGDEGEGGVIRYSSIHGDDGGLFLVNPDTGDVSITQPLDFEFKSVYNFVVMATDSSPLNLTNYTNVLVHVTDIDDNAPYFINTNYTVTVNSQVEIGTEILRLVAMDADQGTNAELQYFITAGNNLSLFRLQSVRQPSLRTDASLATMAGLSVNLTIEAHGSSNVTSTEVTVMVQAGQAFGFTLPSYSATVAEDSISSIIFELSTVAISAADFTIESGDPTGVFTVDSFGTVRLVGGELDHEITPTYQLTVSTTGVGGEKAYATLTVSISDINDIRPEFISDSFLVHIPETTPIGAHFFTTMATDRDGSAPANVVEYAIVTSHPDIASTFDIDPVTGGLSLLRALDYEGGDLNFTFAVSATNSAASPSHSSEATITVEILNGNNHVPEFTTVIDQPVILYENVSTGLSIFNVTAVDGDEGSAEEITFGLRGNHRYFDFSIDSFTGEIKVNGDLDFERERRYQLEIIASDRGNPSLSSSTFLTVNILDINDNSPVWDQEVYMVSLLENSSVGFSVIEVGATDEDGVDTVMIDGQVVLFNRNGYVTYNITEGDPEGNFFVDPDAGIVTVHSPLDRESVSEYNLTLTATDGGERFATAQLYITILDNNDIVPTFAQSVYTVAIPESSPNGTFLVTVMASDTDLRDSSVFFYDIVSGNINDTFALNVSTGEIWLDQAVLDREIISFYNLTVEAVDLGDPPLTGSTQILIQVLDLNEFPPVFSQETYTGSVHENAPSLTPVLSVNTSDLDYGENATAMYSIVSGNNQSRFGITVSTGEIFVANPSDFEVVQEYELVVMATDSGPISTQLSSVVNVTITILDVNDNHPLFTNSSYSAVVREDASPLSPVLTLQVTDADSGSNAEFLFSLDLQGAVDNFIVDPQTGLLSLSADVSFDREQVSSYQFIAIVTDQGEPPLNSSVPVTIVIADVNDNHPLFSAPYYNASMVENAAAGTFVTMVTASDEDIGSNADITYSIQGQIESESDCISTCNTPTDFCETAFSSSSPPSSPSPLPPPPFTVDNTTGAVSTLLPLDRENTSSYLLTIMASDSGNETRLTSLACLLVTVLDDNDEHPTFTQDIYTASISEYSTAGDLVAQVTAEDRDLSSNAEITYHLLTESGSFTINPMTGEIFTLGEFDREERDEYNLSISATDHGDFPLNSTAVVIVTILDENDNSPSFSQSLYEVSLSENQPPLTSVLQLEASDADITSNAELRYSISESLPQSHFQINSTTGLLETTVELDREEIMSYVVTIFSTDMGTPPRNSSTQVNVTVVDTNDHAPSFTQEEYSTQVNENLVPENPILTLMATDMDVGTNSLILFNLSDVTPPSDAFSLHPVSGDLWLLSPLDAEQSLTYNLTVVASNGDARPEQTAEVTVLVAVGDVNDHTPMFSQEDYIVVVNESARVGSEVIQLLAADEDATLPNSEFTFAISGGQNLSLFAIDPLTGVIFVSNPLDREREPTHILQVTVHDNGTDPGPRSSTVSVTIVLADANDNTPVFEQSHYSFTIHENEPAGSLIGQVRANDIDLNSVTYSIMDGQSSTGEALFEVAPESGELFSAISFDREEESMYSFVVIATDNGTILQRNAEVTVNVTILDLNDVPPSFSLPSYSVAWPEDTAVGSVLLTVVAADSDLGEAGRVEYAIAPGNDSSFFSIDAATGNVSLVGEFNRETQDLFVFEVVARDLGMPSLTSSVVVMVTVLDINDNVPVLNATEYSTVWPEDTPLATPLLAVSATDEDIEQNGEIRFSITEDFGGTFSIDEESGVLYLTSSLDYEDTQNYTFSVVAIDTGEPPQSSSAEVFILVTDLNDNPPVFQSTTFQTAIPENAILQTPVFLIPATDSDSTSNGELRFSILAGNLAAAFEVDETSGLISLSDYLDREITDSYTLSIRAVDQGLPQFTASAEVYVEVVDVNDHSPCFGSRAYSVPVPESAGLGTVVLSVEASDEDIGVNANLSYSILAGDPSGIFDIDPQTGAISVAASLDFETTPTYSLTLLVSDQGQPEAKTDTAILTISVTDTNEHSPTFPQSSYHIDLPTNTPPGALVGVFSATDMDRYMQPPLTYHLEEEEGNATLFSVNGLSGSLHSTSLLPPGDLSVSITASDGFFSSTVSVSLLVFPLSLPLPVFQPAALSLSVPEDTSLGGMVGRVEVTSPHDVIFSLPSDTIPLPFQVTSDGQTNLIGPLDYETTPTYVFSIQATSLSNASLVSQTVVTMAIEDVNDSPPTFASTEYILHLPELTPVGTALLSVAGFDLDSPGVNSEFEFSIAEGNEEGTFSLDPSTGELVLARELDYEQERVIVLIVNISNHLSSTVLTGQAVVRMDIMDDNDHSPQFSEPYYQVDVSASALEGTEVLTLTASDLDSGSNAELVYSLTHLDVPLSFTVNYTSGVIATGAAFSSVVQSYVISAAVADRGAPQPRSDTTTVFITVVPDNNFAPEFSQPGGYAVQIMETLPIGGSVEQISASDPDSIDAEITFSIESGDPEDKFTIDPSTGLITLSSNLVYQEQSLYLLIVTAEDDGTPSRISSVALNVSVEDINNHAPLFEEEVYHVTILENATVGSPVVQITASDPDAASLTYVLTVNAYQDGLPLFSLDPASGLLSTAAPVDREFAERYELLVSAVDSGYAVRLSTSAPLIIDLIDLNDTPPQFDQSEYTFSLLRYLAPDLYVATVTATDSDLIGQSLEYTITDDTSGGLLAINSSTGDIWTTSRVPEEAIGVYRLEVAVGDGEFVVTVSVVLELTAEGDYCEASGLCTSVRPVNCSFIQFGSCDPRILGNLYDPYCPDSYVLSPDQFLCLQHSCLDPSLSPCLPSSSCLPPAMACAGLCPEGTSICPTTDICHVTSLQESCDGSNVTCLIGQTLVQEADDSRVCVPSSSLPPSAANCSASEVYCMALGECSDLSSPTACQACPPGLLLCVDTRECVHSSLHCCGENGYFCDVLGHCLGNGEVCQLPNVAPVVDTPLIYVESVLNFEPNLAESGDGHVISQLLSNDSNSPAVDSQGEEVSIAIIEIPNIPQSEGEWQYGVCTNASGMEPCQVEVWNGISDVSEENALLLPSSARVRFVRRAVELEGAVWMRVRLWDGNQDGYLSPVTDIVRFTTPRYASTLPFTPTGAFSEDTTLLSLLLLPSLPPPQFSTLAPLHFSNILEDTLVTSNHGNTLQELVVEVSVPNLKVLPEGEIEGFPELSDSISESVGSYGNLLPLGVREEYLERVREVNPTRLQRQRVMEQGYSPGVGIRLNSNTAGNWQVSWNGDVMTYVFLDTLISSSNQILLLNTTARIRFVPNPDYCGQVSIPLQAWDGYWNETESMRTEGGFLVAMETDLSPYNLNSQLQEATQVVECVPDKPVILVSQVQLEPVSYYISYDYERLFTLIVSMEASSLRVEQDRLAELLRVILEEAVTIVRIAAAGQERSQVSFTVEGDSLPFEDVHLLLEEKRDVLSAVGFPLSNTTQTAYYGPGEGCSSSPSPLPIPGVAVTSLTSQLAQDRDRDTLGMAVTAADSAGQQGVWQYLRGNVNNNANATTNEYDTTRGPWINFPPGTSESKALLLHSYDWIRFVPKPQSFWTTNPPAITIKIWDMSVTLSSSSSSSSSSSFSRKALLSSINTDPLVDTVQSLYLPVGLFSDDVTVIEAGRYGCDDVINSGLTFDSCCVCGGAGDSCAGCDGVIGSGQTYDSCGVCDGDGDCEGCDFVPFSNAQSGDCGECVSVYGVDGDLVMSVLEEVGEGVMDCDGVCYGSGVGDECGVCSGGDTGHQYNSDIDCAGHCFGNATLDSCGDCTGPGTTLTPNQNQDCTGVCGGPFREDSCGICQLPSAEGEVTEYRDCLGVCFGSAILDGCGMCYPPSSAYLAESSRDVCGVCAGDNSSCLGCDGTPASGEVVDSCGACGGNDCGCFRIDYIDPQWGPKAGGTEVLIHGAGFFLNDSFLLNFDFDPQRENCGAPRVFSSGESISATCRFVSGENNDITADDVTIVNQSTIRCVTKATTTDLLFSVFVAIDTGDFSNGVVFQYYDETQVFISDITPSDVEINQEINVTFQGENFVDTRSSVCFIWDTGACGMDTEGSDPVIVPANYISETEISCTLPPATSPCEVRVQMSLDGQTSGVVAPGDITFTYRYSAPKVEVIYFSDDLSNLIIQLDRSVEVAGSPSSSPTCSEVFSADTLALLGESMATCQWSNSRQDEVAVSLPPSALVDINSLVSLREGAIVTRGETYSFAVSGSDMFSVDSGLSFIPPVAVINGPHSIPPCGSVKFTGSHSLNPGYRGMTYLWSVLTVDSATESFSNITQYLNTLTATTDSISLQSSWFVSGLEYHLQLVVVNSIGLESRPDTVRLVRGEGEPLPQLFIRGTEEREVRSGESVILESGVFTPDCATAEYQFEFLWQLFEVTDERRGIMSAVDISSLPTLSPILLLPSSLLTPGSTYIAMVTASSTTASYSETINVTITTATISLQAHIHGGDRSISETRTLVLDARGSTYDSSLPSPSFSWSCSEAGSGQPCYNASLATPTPLVIPAADTVSIPGSDMESGLNYNFTVSLFQSGAGWSHFSTVIEVVSATPPIVEVTGGEGEWVTSREVVLRGLVYSGSPVTRVTWDSVRMEGQGYLDLSDTSLSLGQTSSLPSSTTSHISRANLVLPPNSLTPHLTYIFQLTAENEGGAAIAQVSITPDPPPHSFSLSIQPETGVALETIFTISVTGALDSDEDSPFLYQFGVLSSPDEEAGGASIMWLSGAQFGGSIETVLPSLTHNLTLLARVFDRHGGYSDTTSPLSILPSPSLSDAMVRDLLTQLTEDFTATKNWETLLHNLVGVAMELNSDPTLSPSLKQEVLTLFLDIFSNHLPASGGHYDLTSQLLLLLTTNSELGGDSTALDTAAALREMVEWYRRETTVQVSLRQPLTGTGDEPLQLLPMEELSSPSDLLSLDTAASLFASWSNLVSPVDTPATIAMSLAEGVQSIADTLCQERVYGEDPSLVTSSAVELYTHKVVPTGRFDVSGRLVEFDSALEETYLQQACLDKNKACSETCFQGARYPFDLFAEHGGAETQIVQLSSQAQNTITTEIEGADPLFVELVSDVLSVTVSIPSQNGFLTVNNLESPLSVYLPLRDPVPSNESIALCLFRSVGGEGGFSDTHWQLDSTSAAERVRLDSVDYFKCQFSHLTEFAVGLLPPPIILPPSTSLPPSPSPSPSTSTAVPVTTPAIIKETPTVITQPVSGTSPAAYAVPVILILALAVVVSVVIIIFIVWRKKRAKKAKIAPGTGGGEGPSGLATDEQTNAKLIRSGPLTPEESKVPMTIIQLLSSGEREVVGTMSVLPAIRLRELRYHITDNFASFKSKPFYFLTRQLVDIEPPSEQQQFVSLVYGQTDNQPIFVRKVEITSDLTRLHFCICGNAAQFECSSCSAQGYCSPECQGRDWTERHQKECGRLGEKKKRMSVLRRQATLSPIEEHPRLAPSLSLSPERLASSSAAPVDFRSLLNSQRSFQRPPLSSQPSTSSSPQRRGLPPLTSPMASRTTLGMLATQPRPPVIREEEEEEVEEGEGIGEEEEGGRGESRSFAKLLPRQTGHSTLPPLSTSPGRSFLASPSPLSPLSTSLLRSPPQGPSLSLSSSHRPLHPAQTTPTSQRLFQRANPQYLSPKRHVAPATKQLSLQSVKSEDFDDSVSSRQQHNIRNEPQLESDKSETTSESESEEEEEGEGRLTAASGREEPRPSTTPLTTRPPSLSVRSKKSAKTASSSSSPSSSSESGSESESPRSHSVTPVATQQDKQEHKQD